MATSTTKGMKITNVKSVFSASDARGRLRAAGKELPRRRRPSATTRRRGIRGDGPLAMLEVINWV